MRRLLTSLLLLTAATTVFANLSQQQIHSLKSGERFVVQHIATESSRDPRTPLDQGGEDCFSATEILSLPYCDAGTTAGYNDDYYEECLGFPGAPDVVYRFAPTFDMDISISLTSEVYSTYLQVYETDTDCNDLWFYDCNNSVPTSCLEGITVYSGYIYYIVVDGDWQESGDYILNVTEGFGCESTPCSDNGENCNNAIVISSLPFSASETTAGMADDYTFCGYEPGAPDVVFTYTPTYTHLADILTCGNTLFESSLYIFRDGNTGSPYGDCAARPCFTFYNGFWRNAGLYCVEFEVGHTYCIVLDGAWSYSFGPYVLEMFETEVQACNVSEYCPAPLTETEPNNACGQFDSHTLVGNDTLAGNICEPGDEDYYTVTVPEDSLYIVWVHAGPDCAPGLYDLGNSFVYPDGCYETEPCAGCGWIIACGPETQGIRVGGLGNCYTGPYHVAVDVEPTETDACDPIACTTAPAIACNVPTVVNTCDGCQTPICQTYRDGNSGPRGYTGPQKFFELNVPATANYTVQVADDAQVNDVQFSIFTDCVLPRTTCVYAQDRNYWSEQPTGAIWEETGAVSLDPGTYYLHVSFANSECGDLDVLVTCDATPCLPPDSVTVKWNTSSHAELRFISDGGTYDIFSTNIPNNDGDPRGGDPQWTQRATLFGPAGPALWTDTNVSDAYRNYVVLKGCP